MILLNEIGTEISHMFRRATTNETLIMHSITPAADSGQICEHLWKRQHVFSFFRPIRRKIAHEEDDRIADQRS